MDSLFIDCFSDGYQSRPRTSYWTTVATKKQLLERWNTEPWRSIDQEIVAFCTNQALQAEPWKSPDPEALFALLDGLPFREEIPSGRDLRASSFPGAKNMDLREADLSYCHEIGSFIDCDLERARLEEIRGEVHYLLGRFVETSFRGAGLRKASLERSHFERCDFSNASLRSAHMGNSVFRDCCFQGADCEGADLQLTDLCGCDFRAAKLNGAMFRAVKLDAKTDLRGAELFDLVCDEQRDFSGRLVLPGTDWTEARHDETTRCGSDPTAVDREILRLIQRQAKREGAAWAEELARQASRSARVLKKNPGYRWYEALLDSVEPQYRSAAEELIQRASMEL